MTAFRMFDTERTGYIAADVFRKVLLRISPFNVRSASHSHQTMTSYGEAISKAAVEDMIETADTNRDGFIHYEALVDMVFQAATAAFPSDL